MLWKKSTRTPGRWSLGFDHDPIKNSTAMLSDKCTGVGTASDRTIYRKADWSVHLVQSGQHFLHWADGAIHSNEVQFDAHSWKILNSCYSRGVYWARPRLGRDGQPLVCSGLVRYRRYSPVGKVRPSAHVCKLFILCCCYVSMKQEIRWLPDRTESWPPDWTGHFVRPGLMEPYVAECRICISPAAF